jgi:hypothetical protein
LEHPADPVITTLITGDHGRSTRLIARIGSVITPLITAWNTLPTR